MDPTSMTSLPLEDKHSPKNKSVTALPVNRPCTDLNNTDRKNTYLDNTDLDHASLLENTSILKNIGSIDIILKHMVDAIILTDSDETIIYVNPAWEKLNGYLLDDVRGQTPAILNSSVQQPMWENVHAEIKNGNTWRGEIVNRRADGREYETALTIAPIQNDDGETTHFIGVSRDVTEKNAFLRAQETFATNVAHELRTPLTNIKFYLSLLEKGSAESRERYMDTLKRESTRLQAITEDILLLSQFDMNKVILCIDSIDLHSLVKIVVAEHSKLATKNQVDVEFHLDTDSLSTNAVTLESDSLLLSELLGQLLTNAITYTDSGGQVEVRATVTEKENQSWYAISVQDNGFGIDPSERERIFERFYRGRSGYEMSIAGTGLGLTICQEIAQRLGGTIEVESTPQAGSTFTLFLPATTQQIQRDPLLSRYAAMT